MAAYGPKDPHKTLADIFAKMKSGARDKLMHDLDARDHAAAERIRDLMFTFDDLGSLDARSAQVLLGAIDHKTLALALKGATVKVQAVFFTNLSKRAETILREDMEALGPVRASEVDAARAEIAATAKRLADDGKISIQGGGEQYVT